MNNCCFTGRLTRDPELKQTTTGKSVCSFTLAVARPRVKDTTDFINFVVWNQGAEFLCKYAKKGNMVEVSAGVLTGRTYEDSNGNKRVAFEVVADIVKLLSSASEDAPKQAPTENANSSKTPYSVDSVAFEEQTADDELPF